jgi:hypothetical protein
MKCKHYKGEGYTYELGDGQELNLCSQCEMILLADMKKLETIENKVQAKVNEIFEREIDILKREIELLKKPPELDIQC